VRAPVAPTSPAPQLTAQIAPSLTQVPAAQTALVTPMAAAAPGAANKVKIGVTVTFDDPWLTLLRGAMAEYAKSRGPDVEVIFADSQGDPNVQRSQVNDFVAQKMDAIVIVPADTETTGLMTDAVTRAKIPLVYVNGLPGDLPDGVAYVGSKSIDAGIMQMDWIAKKLGGKGNVVIIQGALGHEAAQQRTAGVEQAARKYPDIKITKVADAYWERYHGQLLMKSWLASGEQIDAVAANNDEMALGALDAIEAAGKLGKIVVGGVDATPAALAAMDKGRLNVTVFQNAKEQGVGGIKTAVALAGGDKADMRVWVPYELVTPENYKQYLASSPAPAAATPSAQATAVAGPAPVPATSQPGAAPQPTRPDLTFKDLSGVWGSSGSDVFAVGQAGTILHYDGQAWSPMSSGTPYNLWAVCGSSADDIFAVGERGTILHYDGHVWTSMKSGTGYMLGAAWCNSSRDVFVVGNLGTILHYDGSAWSPMNSGTLVWLTAVWGSSDRDIFVAGSRDGVILHYDGSNWSAAQNEVYTGPLWGAWGGSGRDVFVTGDSGTILHFDGSAWSPMNSGTAGDLWSASGSSGRDIFVVGTGAILHYDGSAWSLMNSDTTINMKSVWANSGRDVFAAGHFGTILHYDGQAWSTMISGAH
jgi:inositol transport system substrate-binding protein